MLRSADLRHRLACRLALYQRVLNPLHEPRNQLVWLKPLQAWQAQRLEQSFAVFLRNPAQRPAAAFFLSDIYGENDFAQRDAQMMRVMPQMQRILPARIVETLVDGITLGTLSHALDLRVAQALHELKIPPNRLLAVQDYAKAYRQAGHPRLRAYQLELILAAGKGLANAMQMPGIDALLKMSRLPARLAGLNALQSFLERGYQAFSQLEDVDGFLKKIAKNEQQAMLRLFEGHSDPFSFTMGNAVNGGHTQAAMPRR